MTGQIRHRVTGRQLGRVLGLWTGISLAIVVIALGYVLPISVRLPWGDLIAILLGTVTLIAVGVWLYYRAPNPWIVLIGIVALLWAALSFALGCPGRMCEVPAGYEHWRNIKIAFDIGPFGPRLLASSEVEPCAFDCPYKLQLIPLAIGYLTYAHPLTATSDS